MDRRTKCYNMDKTTSSSTNNKRTIFDKMALNCLYYLENCFPDCAMSIDFQAGDEALLHEIISWDRKNSPYKLPSDLKNFYSMFNGVNVCWSIDLSIDKPSIPIGEFRINRIEDIQKVNIEHVVNMSSFNVLGSGCTVYSLDKLCDVGEVVLLYRHVGTETPGTVNHDNSFSSSGSTDNLFLPRQLISNASRFDSPEVWLIDLSSRLHYLCSSFTHYFRVMVAHMGITGWQLSFTPEGLPMHVQHWMGVFCKERLIVDRYCHEKSKTG